MNSYFGFGDWAIIIVYLAAMIVLGVWFGKDQHNTRDYFLGSRDIPWWGIGASIIATETSALTIIGVPAIAYAGNLGFLQMILGYVIARVILAAVMVPHYMRGEIFSPYQLLEQHLGREPRRLAGALFMFLEPLSAGVRVYVACIPVRLMLGDGICSLGGIVDPIFGAILLFVALSVVYTYVGGMKAVVWTDAVQMVLFIAGGVFALTHLASMVEGGLAGGLAKAAAAGKTEWLRTDFSFGAPFNLWMGLIGGTVMVLSSHGADQLIVQRVLACRDVAEGRRALIFSAVLIFPLFLLFLLVGVMLWVFYQSHPFQIPLPESRPGIKSNDFIFPIYIVTEMPHLMKGFLIVAILAAAMSSISSAVSALASVSTMDFLKPALPGRDDAFFLRFSRHSTLVWAAALVFVAWLTREVTFVLNAAFSLRGLTSGALLGGLILALFGRGVGPRAAVAGMLTALVVMNVIYWPATVPSLREAWLRTFGGEVFWPWFTLIGTLTTIGTAALVARLWPQRT